MRDDHVLVRVAPAVLEQLATKDSQPVVILGLDKQGDETYEMVLRSVVSHPKPKHPSEIKTPQHIGINELDGEAK